MTRARPTLGASERVLSRSDGSGNTVETQSMTNHIGVRSPVALGILVFALGASTSCGKNDDGGGSHATGGAHGGEATEAGAPSRAGAAPSRGGAAGHGGDRATHRPGGSTAGGEEGVDSGGEGTGDAGGSSPGGEGNSEIGGEGGRATGAGGTGGSETDCEPGTQARCGDVDATLLGNCAEGTMTCRGSGTWGTCSVRAGTRDACDVEGDDADCNGIANEDCDCLPGDTTPCGPETDDGICEFGEAACVNGVWGSCEGAVYPAARNCSSPADNDCDGEADDTNDDTCACEIGTSEPCEDPDKLDGIGICLRGTRTCQGSGATAFWGNCVDAVAPSTEVCDEAELDEDCDGMANEDCDCVDGDERACPDCTGATQACEDGEWQACTGTPPEPDTYYLDEDGDGFGVGNADTNIEGCSGPPEGYADRAGDCCDTDANAFPTQTVGGTVPTNCERVGFDYDCRHGEEPQITADECTRCSSMVGCGCVGFNECLDGAFWGNGNVPACGREGILLTCVCGECTPERVLQPCL